MECVLLEHGRNSTIEPLIFLLKGVNDRILNFLEIQILEVADRAVMERNELILGKCVCQLGFVLIFFLAVS